MEPLTTVRVNAGAGYEVKIGRGLLDRAGGEIRALFGGRRAMVVTDSNVAPLYLERLMRSLEEAGVPACSAVFPAGEANKNMQTLTGILNSAAEHQLTRKDYLIALGGGVCGDMTGFAAGCYMRGIPFVQIPTTVLAMVDSSVGGKCAVDLPAGKNLAGVFHQPSLVLCDLGTLDTLPAGVFSDGMAEAVKTAVLTGGDLAVRCGRRDPEDLLPIIADCVRYKAGVVERDEKELGERKLLNLGHTPGHAIEKCSGYTVPHGHAVAAGLAVMARAADARGLSDGTLGNAVEEMLKTWDLPVRTGYTAGELLEAARSDKKSAGNTITAVLPFAVGHCGLADVSFDELYELFESGI